MLEEVERPIYERMRRARTVRLVTERPGDGRRVATLAALAERVGVGCVATNDVHFPKAEMYEAHDALICIAEGAYVDQQEPRRKLTTQHYFKSAAEMAALFAEIQRMPRELPLWAVRIGQRDASEAAGGLPEAFFDSGESPPGMDDIERWMTHLMVSFQRACDTDR